MFVQVIQGKVSDPEAFERLGQRWEDELRPGAIGFLGSTEGVSADGSAILMARFADEASARANSERPEQGAWYAEFEKCFEGSLTFAESSDVDIFRAGGSNDAGFVQVMQDSGADQAQIRRFDAEFERLGAGFRPDLIGGVRVWPTTDSYIEFAYFTSEAEARAGEQTEPPAELAATLEGFQAAMANVTFTDLKELHLF